MATKVFQAHPISGLRFNARVDFVIPFYGQYEKVTKAVESIFRCVLDVPYHVCLVDDASPNQDFGQQLSKINSITYIRNDKQKGFGYSMQRGFMATVNPYIVFMNSDCEISDMNWVSTLGLSLLELKDQNVRMIVPRTNNPVNGDSRQLGEKGELIDDVILEEGFLSMYCFMCHRELFDRMGGFIKPYPYGFYEDEEFAFRMGACNFKQAISGKTWIYHHGESTIDELWRTDPSTREEMEDNRERCKKDMQEIKNKMRPSS